LAGNLVEIREYVQRSLSGIARYVAVVSESPVEANPSRAYYQQKRNDVLVPHPAVDLARFAFGFGLANVDNRNVPLWPVVGRCVQYVRAAQITAGLLCLAKNVAEIAIRFQTFARKEIGRTVVLKRVQDAVKIHSKPRA
jgi:hypothetical protein